MVYFNDCHNLSMVQLLKILVLNNKLLNQTRHVVAAQSGPSTVSTVFILEIKDYYETRDSAGVVTKLVIYYKDLSKLVKNSNLPKMGHYGQKSRGATVDSL
ncbi:hypothetical protein BDEG_22120 [Batrachochytrium dendrobatidis JEL423]|uniref:Uncharacterized protein n=1 Tax=Batrachochytrium dendrobatidis (strain JEL423) TaxID=403673 RepID=A0A177WDI5_BATDL|nr:hypothetical protein BDEG_22120 [Batrachochytrium dendrobatidis JEL423]